MIVSCAACGVKRLDSTELEVASCYQIKLANEFVTPLLNCQQYCNNTNTVRGPFHNDIMLKMAVFTHPPSHTDHVSLDPPTPAHVIYCLGNEGGYC